jgi:hypothetical protein
VLVLGWLVVPTVRAQDPTSGLRLTEAFGFSEVSKIGGDVCDEKMEQTEVEETAEGSPNLFGGIKPGDAEWPKVRELYIAFLKSGCHYDTDALERDFARSMEQSLSPADIQALVDFYNGELGGKYRSASLKANNASFKAAKLRVESAAAYAEYDKQVQALLTQRPKPIEKVRDLKTVQSLPTPDAAVVLADQVMKQVSSGQLRQAVATAAPHAVVTDEQMETLVSQIEGQAESIKTRFGGSLGYELLRNDTVGGFLQRTVFLHRFEKHAMVWMFLWYRGKDGWVLNNISYVDNPSLLFQ